MLIPPEKVVRDLVDNERKLVADFIRLAHHLMTHEALAQKIEDGSYLEIIAERKQAEFEQSLKGCEHE